MVEALFIVLKYLTSVIVVIEFGDYFRMWYNIMLFGFVTSSFVRHLHVFPYSVAIGKGSIV